jgi:hypothetical protein
MKTNFVKQLLLMTLIFSLLSCTKDENVNDSKGLILLKKKVITHSINDIETFTYEYDRNKIVSLKTDGGFVRTYTYTGNQITRIFETSLSGFQRSIDFTYIEGKIFSRIEKSSSEGTRTIFYTHNTDGSISIKYSGNNGAGIAKLSMQNGNIIKYENGYNTYTYEFDNKNNPFKNVLGFNLLLEPNDGTFSPNNMTKYGGAGGEGDYYDYKYNNEGYPTEMKKRNVPISGSDRFTQFYY